ncbi:SLC13 family permease [Imhoffiella purpurea]|uniref:Di-and tricarboxylate transporter n=1 Tax=Imhoffiella purpurea TaxID=1249627 RepID=W9VBY1_9GAMM|nr:SLC13 family permease [Imhoffiella purpurea]EXJ13547.1 Di- and tricarboxylate transporter [Imhoffiella purpurea]
MRLRVAFAISGMALLAALVFPHFLPSEAALALALAVFALGLWATAAVAEYWTALAFFLLAVIFRIAPPQVVFSGFTSSTFWLLFGGLIIGAAMRHTGLDHRLGHWLSGAGSLCYAWLIASIVAFGVALGFVMPSSVGRAVLLMPIVAALAVRLGYAQGANGHTGMLLAAAFGSHVPTFAILPSNVPNMILAGSAETLYGIRFGYWDYLWLHFPVLGLLKSLLLVLLVVRLFPDADPLPVKADRRSVEPMTPHQRRLGLLLLLCLVLWLTDSLHGIAPAWVSLGAALVCLWPGSGLTGKDTMNKEVNHASLLFIAGILGLGAVVAYSGLGPLLVDGLTAMFGLSPGGGATHNAAVLAAISTAVAAATTLPGVPAVMTPSAQALADLTGLPLATVLMTQVLGFSNVLLPYQSPPLLVAIQLGALSTAAVTRLCLTLFAATALVLTPLDLVWWRLIGWL